MELFSDILVGFSFLQQYTKQHVCDFFTSSGSLAVIYSPSQSTNLKGRCSPSDVGRCQRGWQTATCRWVWWSTWNARFVRSLQWKMYIPNFGVANCYQHWKFKWKFIGEYLVSYRGCVGGTRAMVVISQPTILTFPLDQRSDQLGWCELTQGTGRCGVCFICPFWKRQLRWRCWQSTSLQRGHRGKTWDN